MELRPQRLPGCGQVDGEVRHCKLLSIEVVRQELGQSEQKDCTTVKQCAGGTKSGARETSRRQAETLTFSCEAPTHTGFIGSKASGDEAGRGRRTAPAAAVPNRDMPVIEQSVAAEGFRAVMGEAAIRSQLSVLSC